MTQATDSVLTREQLNELAMREANLRLNAKRDFMKACNTGTVNVLKQNEQLLSMTASRLNTGSGGGHGGSGGQGGDDVDPKKLGQILDTVPYGTHITINEYNGGPAEFDRAPKTQPAPPAPEPEPYSPPVVTVTDHGAKTPPAAAQLSGAAGTRPTPPPLPKQQPGSSWKDWLLPAGLLAAGTLGGVGLANWMAADRSSMSVEPPAESREYEATLEWEIEGGEVTTEVNAIGEGEGQGTAGQ